MEEIAWATVNKQDGGGKLSGSGRAIGCKLAAKNVKKLAGEQRSAEDHTVSATKAAATCKRNAAAKNPLTTTLEKHFEIAVVCHSTGEIEMKVLSSLLLCGAAFFLSGCDPKTPVPKAPANVPQGTAPAGGGSFNGSSAVPNEPQPPVGRP